MRTTTKPTKAADVTPTKRASAPVELSRTLRAVEAYLLVHVYQRWICTIARAVGVLIPAEPIIHINQSAAGDKAARKATWTPDKEATLSNVTSAQDIFRLPEAGDYLDHVTSLLYLTARASTRSEDKSAARDAALRLGLVYDEASKSFVLSPGVKATALSLRKSLADAGHDYPHVPRSEPQRDGSAGSVAFSLAGISGREKPLTVRCQQADRDVFAKVLKRCKAAGIVGSFVLVESAKAKAARIAQEARDTAASEASAAVLKSIKAETPPVKAVPVKGRKSHKAASLAALGSLLTDHAALFNTDPNPGLNGGSEHVA